MSAPPKTPRIAPGGRHEVGPLVWALLSLAARRSKGSKPNVMLVLARHRKMFLPWLWFASKLMPYGTMPAEDSELLILRVAHRCDSEYERVQHEQLGKRAGLGEAVIAWTAGPVGALGAAPAGSGIDAARAAVLVDAADELIDTHTLSDDTWAALAEIYTAEHQQIEFCMLVGHYVMLAGTLNAAGVQLEDKIGMYNLR